MKYKKFRHLVAVAAVLVFIIALALPSPTLAGMTEAKAAFNARDYKTAFREYLPLAEAGNAEAQFWIGDMYRFGLGRPQDYNTAIQWFKRSANNGYVRVMISLGYMAGKGQGMKSSKESENGCNTIAAKYGISSGQWNLYISLRKNHSTISKAREWLKRAVKQGHTAAMARHGYVLVSNFFRSDKTEGLMYMWLGIENGHDPEVVSLLKGVVGDDPEMIRQLETAKDMAKAWKPVKEIPPTDLPAMDYKKCFPE